MQARQNEGGLQEQGGTKDPVSGNDVPIGSLKEEVRDDIPAMLSEGEFVFPADVTRYYGLDTLMKMRQKAKQGLKIMEAMGQMGNSEEAIVPDDIPFDFDDLEAFGNNNFSIELNDIDDVLKKVEKLDFIDQTKINLVGHSKGGSTAIIKSFEDDRIAKTATLASVIRLKERYASELGDWKKAGVFYIHNGRTNQEMPLYYQLAEDVLGNLHRFDIPELLKTYSKPIIKFPKKLLIANRNNS